ncbi:hypothetical protein GCM10023189_20460 [Nibrella saemangeumensis]|uniref:3-keto-alpha-glucoside-1,2-lyase/3-keto-2-hydroxy-glucal hydratase domain-containing protein n=1 Tax=Nibrella saemangeumensis TaxID=1084526 RepID=A0ABP8MSG6_9BACT
MRPYFLLTLFLLTSLRISQAQTPAGQPANVKITELLAKMPANNAAELQAGAAAVADLGKEGIVALVKKLDETGAVSPAQYALSAFSYAAASPGKENLRALASRAYAAALPRLSSPEAKLFIISQLERVGKDDAVTALIPFLADARLADPAARALATIGTPAAGNALLTALNGAPEQTRLFIMGALGKARFRPAAPAIAALSNSSDAKQAKVALQALAQIGEPASYAVLAKAADKAGYQSDASQATEAYLSYLHQLLSDGRKKEVNKAAKTIEKITQSGSAVATRIAALKLLTDLKGAQSLSTLTAAMKDADPAFRAAALQFGKPYLNEATVAQWLKTFGRSDAPAQADLLRMFGNNGIKAALPLALQAVQSEQPAVKIAAIATAAKLGQTDALPALLPLLKTSDAGTLAAVKSALLAMKGTDVLPAVGQALADASPAGKVAILEILGSRADTGRFAEVLQLTKSTDESVSEAARLTLKQTATGSQVDPLLTALLASTSEKDSRGLQDALVAAIQTNTDASAQQATARTLLNRVPGNKKALLYPVLAGIGGRDNLSEVAKAYGTASSAVINALAGWKGGLAAHTVQSLLPTAGKAGTAAEGVNALLRQLSLGSYTADEKLLMLREAMAYATTPEQKKALLKQVQASKTFPALMYAARYLDQPDLQADAAAAVAQIALGTPSLQGDGVREILQKAIPLLSGPEAGKQSDALRKLLAGMPAGKGFVPLFNGKDLTGWKGLVGDPIKRAKMDKKTLTVAQAKADAAMRTGWQVKDGLLVFTGHGDNLCTDKKYGDFELYVDWQITPKGDAGIYLRGTPQVQIWDTSRTDVGAQVGSGGLYNNQIHASKPLLVADNPVGTWNTFRIRMVGDQVTVYLNGKLVVNNVPLENYWDKTLPIFPEEQIELQAHGTYVAYRDIYIREIPRPQPFTLSDDEKKEGFKMLFDGTNLHEWTGNKTDYVIEDGALAVNPKNGGSGNLYTRLQYSDFIYRFEFKLTPGANNGIGIRAPMKGDAAYNGMEIQVLDNDAEIYKKLQVYQYHGSVYGVIPAKRGYLKPTGEWNVEEIKAVGNRITVTLNGTVILDGDIAEASKNGTLDHREHPGLLNKSGHIGFLGHGDVLYFRNIRVKDLSK